MNCPSSSGTGFSSWFLFFCCLAAMVAGATPLAFPAEVTLGWDPNTEPTLQGYRLHYGTASRSYSFAVDVGDTTAHTVTGLKEGTAYYFAVTAYDLCGNETGYSDELAYLCPPMDTDGDGLTDADETGIYGTDPTRTDTDQDGIGDLEELQYWGDRWSADVDADGRVNLLDRDSDNDGRDDGAEIGVSDPAVPDNLKSGSMPVMEAGEIRLDHTWQAIAFGRAYNDPVVIAGPLGLEDDDPAVIRIRNVTPAGFEIRIQEWDYLDGLHAPETVSYLVMERGSYLLANGARVTADSFETNATGYFGAQAFMTPFSAPPVMMTSITTVNGKEAVTGRLQRITSRDFQYGLQEEEGADQRHAPETVSFIAVEPSTGRMGGFLYEAGRDGNWITSRLSTILFQQVFTGVPVFLADMQTTYGTDTANLRWQDRHFYGAKIRVDEERSRDRECWHMWEVAGYLLLAE